MWRPSFEAPRGDLPVFVGIAQAIADDIRRGRLRAGDALPGSRSLAESLGVHRNTVLAAYRELVAEGWVETTVARGTFVAPDIPRSARFGPAVPGVARRAGFDLAPTGPLLPDPPPPGVMTLSGGVPDVRLVPVDELARATRRVLKRKRVEALSYGDARGPHALRASLGRMLSAMRGMAASADDVLIVRGSQMGFDLVARTLVAPGDVIAVEELGYARAWGPLIRIGAKVVPVRVDAHGLDVDALARVRRLRGVFVTPHHQYPTTVTMAPARRLQLLALAREKRFFVLEDDYDHEFHYEGRPIHPLASADRHGVVVYLGTLSKVLAPGLRLGFVVAPPPVLERLTNVRREMDRHGDVTLELALAELLDDGELQRHVRRARRVYEERRAELAELLREHLATTLSFELPSGGTAIWARSTRDVDRWSARALEEGLAVQSARTFAFDGEPRPYLRLGFAQHDAREAREAVRRLVASRPR